LNRAGTSFSSIRLHKPERRPPLPAYKQQDCRRLPEAYWQTLSGHQAGHGREQTGKWDRWMNRSPRSPPQSLSR
jgi:hypothetical protein